MIVRILSEDQYDLPEDCQADLDHLDEELNQAIESGDGSRFDAALDALISKVRSSGKALGPETIVPSDLTVPHEGSTLEDVRQLLASEPGDSAPVPEGA